MTTSSTRGSGAWFVGWLASGLVTCRQLQTRDGDKSKLRDNGILKAVLNIIDVIAHKLLGMDLWEQAEIDRTMVETPDGSKNDLCWSGANSSADATLAIPRTVCRVGAAKGEVSLCTYISKSAGKAIDKFMMPVLGSNVISGESHAGNLLACSEFLVAPTEAGSVAEDMIIDIEVYHLLKFGPSKDARRDVCNVGDETGFLRVCSSTVKRRIPSPSVLSWISVSCHVANERVTSCPLFISIPKNVQSKSCAETCCGETRSTHLESSVPLVCCKT